jgi:uncharacterized membrane protein YccF (DUF307 family)
MGTLGNIIWLIFGGLFMAVEYFIAALLLMITIIGIPFGLQVMKLALLALWPFDSKVVPAHNQGGCLTTIFNIIWLLLAGIWIAISHVLWGLLFSITIIGIPFGRQHFKLAGLALTPFGYTII